VVIAHDYLSQHGGAERVVLNLLEAFPGSRVVTSIYSPDRTFKEFAQVDVETLWPNRFRPFRSDPRRALPVLASTWSRHIITDADVVICSSSGWSHGVRTTGLKIVYCYNPARWLYQPEDYLLSASGGARLGLKATSRWLKRWDHAQALTAERYLTTSTAVSERIHRAYGIRATIVPPPVSLDPGGSLTPIPGLSPGFLMGVSRSRGYKNTQLICEAVEGLEDERLVVTGKLPMHPNGRKWDERIQGVGFVSDSELRWLYANCKAVVSAAYEDFGLTPLEGNMFGKPAVLLRAGGFLDTLVEGVTGCYIEEATSSSVQEALQRIPEVDPDAVKAHAWRYRKESFAQSMQAIVHDCIAERRSR